MHSRWYRSARCSVACRKMSAQRSCRHPNIFTARTFTQHSEEPSPRASQRTQRGSLACTFAPTGLPANCSPSLGPTAAPGTKISHPHAIALPAAPIPYTMHPGSLKTVEKNKDTQTHGRQDSVFIMWTRRGTRAAIGRSVLFFYFCSTSSFSSQGAPPPAPPEIGRGLRPPHPPGDGGFAPAFSGTFQSQSVGTGKDADPDPDPRAPIRAPTCSRSRAPTRAAARRAPTRAPRYGRRHGRRDGRRHVRRHRHRHGRRDGRRHGRRHGRRYVRRHGRRDGRRHVRRYRQRDGRRHVGAPRAWCVHACAWCMGGQDRSRSACEQVLAVSLLLGEGIFPMHGAWAVR